MIARNGVRQAVLALALLAAQAALPVLAAAPEPSPEAPLVGQLVAKLLEQSHYNRHTIDSAASRQFLRNYLESYDYNHMIFEKADVDAFEKDLGDTLGEKLKDGNVTPAYDIFARFLKRLEERAQTVAQVTASSPTFTADEHFAVDRHEAPWPAGPQEARELWRLRIKNELLQERLNKAKPEEQLKTVTLRYERLLRSYREFDSGDVLQNYLTSLCHTFDPHSDYMAAPSMENFNISMRLSLVGIGAVLRSEDGYAKIVSLVPGGPADADKRLKANDRIEAVAQGDGPWVDAVGMKLDRLVQLIRGEKGTTVRLRIIPADAIDPATRVTVAIVRDEIRLKDQEAKAKIIEAPVPGGRTARIGVIDLPSFYADMKSLIEAKSTTRDVEKLVAYLKREGIDGLILDLRHNGGGSLSEAVMLTGLFIPEGPVVQVKDNHGLVKVLRDPDPGVVYSGPLAVMTSRGSASASEILAAALQDYDRAIVVGEKSTFGKGTVQSIIELAKNFPPALSSYKPGALKLTIQKFYRVSGGSTQHRGVIPDISLPSLNDHMDISESSYKSALPYDEIDPASTQRMTLASPRAKELQRLSSQRVASSIEFAWRREDIERYKKQKEEKKVSLNEQKRLAEKQADEARAQARKKERSARRVKPLEASEITLETVDANKPPVKSTAAVTVPADAADYDKAPPEPDIELEEGARIVADMARQALPQPPAEHSVGKASLDNAIIP